MDHRQRYLGLIGYLSFIFFTFSLLISQYVEYVNSIYSIVPIWGWFSFILALVSGVLLIYTGARKPETHSITFGVLLVSITFVVFWFLAQFLGLRFWSGPGSDLLHHYGIARQAVATGNIPSSVVYPPIHVLLAELREITELPYGIMGPLLTLPYYSTFIMGIYVAVRRFSSSNTALYVLLASIPLFYQRFVHHLTPWVMFIAFVPLMVVFLDEFQTTHSHRQRMWIGGGAILLSVAIGIGHPMSSLVGFAALAVVAVSFIIGNRILFGSAYCPVGRVSLLLPLAVAYPIWYLSRGTFHRYLVGMVTSVFAATRSTGVETVSQASASGYTLSQLIVQYLIINWGTVLLMVGVGGLIAAIIAVRVLRQRASINEFAAFSLYLSGLGLAVVLLVGNFVTAGTAMVRLNQLAVVASVILIGGGLWWSVEQASNDLTHVLRYPLLAVVILGVITTPFTVYGETQHINEGEFVGVDWYLENANWQPPVYESQISGDLTRYLRGAHREPTYKQGVFKTGPPLPKRLGYDENETIKQSINMTNYYMVTKSRDMKWYKSQPNNRYPHIMYYTQSDTERLAWDSAVNRIYDNGGLSIWRSTE